MNTPLKNPGIRKRQPLRKRMHDRIVNARVALTLRRCDAVGRDVHLHGSPVVENLGRLTIGNGFQLASVPVVSHLVTGPAGEIAIGDCVTIGHGAGITSHLRISIGDHVRIGAFALIMDTDFHEAGDRGSASEPKAITIGAGARIGDRVTILRGATIGAGAVVLAGSVVSGDVPAGARVSGVPARGISDSRESSRWPDAPTMSRVRQVIQRTFGLSAPPADAAAPEAVEGWDSLGTLNLLLSLEDEFCIALEPEDLLLVRTVGDLLPIVEHARRR